MATERRVSWIITANVKQWQKGLNKAQRRMDRFGRKMQRAGRSLTRNLTVPIAGAAAAAVKTASDFESSMTRIETLVGLSREQVQGMRKDVLQLAGETANAPRELSEALFAVTSAGIRGAEAMEVLERAAKASAIGLGETREIARATTAILQAYGKENINAAEATDKLTAIVREGNLEASELAPVLGRVVGIASQLDVSFSEVGASIATFTRLGVSAEEAVTGLRGIMNALLKPTEQGRKALDKVGLSFKQLRQQVSEDGLTAVLRNLVSAFDGNVEGLSKVIPRVRALAAVMGTAGAQGEQYSQILQNIEESAGIVNKGLERVSETTQFKFNEALSTLTATGIELGTVMLPLVNDMLGAFQKLIDRFQDLSKEIKKRGLIIAGVVGAGGPILTAIGFMISTLASISWPVVLGVTALSGVISTMINNWEGFSSFFTSGKGSEMWGSIKRMAMDLFESLKSLFRSITDFALTVWDKWGDEILQGTKDALNAIKTTFEVTFDILGTVLDGFTAAFKGDWDTFFDNLEKRVERWKETTATDVKDVALFLARIADLITISPGEGGGLDKMLGTDVVDLDKYNRKLQEAGQTGNNIVGIFKSSSQFLSDMGLNFIETEKNASGLSDTIGIMATDSQMLLRTWEQLTALMNRDFSLPQPEDQSGDVSFSSNVGSVTSRIAGVAPNAAKVYTKQIGKMKAATTRFSSASEAAFANLELAMDDLNSSAQAIVEKFKIKLYELSNTQANLLNILTNVANTFTQSFGQGMTNLIVRGKKLIGVLNNIGRLLASSFIQKGLSILLSGGLIGDGFFGKGGGLIGNLFGSIFGANDALVTSNGDIVNFHPDDNILAMKDFSKLGMAGGGSQTLNNNLFLDGDVVWRNQRRVNYRRGK